MVNVTTIFFPPSISNSLTLLLFEAAVIQQMLLLWTCRHNQHWEGRVKKSKKKKKAKTITAHLNVNSAKEKGHATCRNNKRGAVGLTTTRPGVAPLLLCGSPPEWQNTCECWHWTCYTQTTAPQEPDDDNNDNSHPCLHTLWSFNYWEDLLAWVLLVSLTGKGVTGVGKLEGQVLPPGW